MRTPRGLPGLDQVNHDAAGALRAQPTPEGTHALRRARWNLDVDRQREACRELCALICERCCEGGDALPLCAEIAPLTTLVDRYLLVVPMGDPLRVEVRLAQRCCQQAGAALAEADAQTVFPPDPADGDRSVRRGVPVGRVVWSLPGAAVARVLPLPQVASVTALPVVGTVVSAAVD